MIICLDFDNTLHDAHHPMAGRKMGPPMPGALGAVQQLRAAGHRLVIHTSRVQQESQAEHVYAWLKYYGFPRIPVSVPKPIAEVYVDDRAVRFASWAEALPAIAATHGQSASS